MLLVPAVKISIFQDSLCRNFFIRFDTITFRTPSNIDDRAFCKISQQFLAVNYFRTKPYLI